MTLLNLTNTLSKVHWRVWMSLLVLTAFTAHEMGYYYGRTFQTYEDLKLYGRIPQDTTWAQFLKCYWQ